MPQTKIKTPSADAAGLPPGWRMVRFGDVVRDVNEAERDPLAAGLERYVGLEHLEPENLHIKRWGLLAEDAVSFTKRFRRGQVLFGKRRAYQRKVAVAEFDGICSSDILTFEPKSGDLLPDLLPFVVQSDGFFDHALGTSSGSLSPRTRWSQLKGYESPLPPLGKQRPIAELLRAADSSVSARARVADTIGQAWQSLVDVAIPSPNDRQLDTQIARLDQLCTMQNGSPFPSSDYQDRGFKLLQPGNLAGTGRLTWTKAATAYRDQAYAEQNADLIVRPGDVVVNLTAQ